MNIWKEAISSFLCLAESKSKAEAEWPRVASTRCLGFHSDCRASSSMSCSFFAHPMGVRAEAHSWSCCGNPQVPLQDGALGRTGEAAQEVKDMCCVSRKTRVPSSEPTGEKKSWASALRSQRQENLWGVLASTPVYIAPEEHHPRLTSATTTHSQNACAVHIHVLTLTHTCTCTYMSTRTLTCI